MPSKLLTISNPLPMGSIPTNPTLTAVATRSTASIPSTKSHSCISSSSIEEKPVQRVGNKSTKPKKLSLVKKIKSFFAKTPKASKDVPRLSTELTDPDPFRRIEGGTIIINAQGQPIPRLPSPQSSTNATLSPPSSNDEHLITPTSSRDSNQFKAITTINEDDEDICIAFIDADITGNLPDIQLPILAPRTRNIQFAIQKVKEIKQTKPKGTSSKRIRFTPQTKVTSLEDKKRNKRHGISEFPPSLQREVSIIQTRDECDFFNLEDQVDRAGLQAQSILSKWDCSIKVLRTTSSGIHPQRHVENLIDDAILPERQEPVRSKGLVAYHKEAGSSRKHKHQRNKSRIPKPTNVIPDQTLANELFGLSNPSPSSLGLSQLEPARPESTLLGGSDAPPSSSSQHPTHPVFKLVIDWASDDEDPFEYDNIANDDVSAGDETIGLAF